MRSTSISSPSSDVFSQAAAEPVVDEQVVQRPPLAVPRAGGALVLLHHRGEQRGDEAGACSAQPERSDRRDRVVLVRHARRAAAGALAHLCDLGLG